MKRLFYILILIGVIAALKIYIVEPVWILGESMEPTLHEGRIYLVNKISYRFRKPKRGEVVSFRTTDDPPLFFVKRIVGLAGERIEIIEGRLLLNSEPLEEPYTLKNKDWNSGPLDIEERCVYVIGDNRTVPIDLQLSCEVSISNLKGPIIGVR